MIEDRNEKEDSSKDAFSYHVSKDDPKNNMVEKEDKSMALPQLSQPFLW